MSDKLRMGLLFGGKSVEHEISLRSARNIFEQLDRTQFIPVLIGISKNGQWHLVDNVDQQIESGYPLNLSLGHSQHTFYSVEAGHGTGKLEVVFPVLHGTDGEDGTIQGMLQCAGIPFAGSGVLGSSVAMDKLISKQLLVKEGIPTSKYVAVPDGDSSQYSYEQIVNEIGLPFMVKPVSLGSSVGVSKVTDEQGFIKASKETLRYDQGFLAEEFISGRELECGVLGNKDAQVSNPGEIIISSQYEFYSYDAKYLDPDAAIIKVPAELDPVIAKRIKELSLRAYQVLRCEDFARVDLFLSEDQSIYINEINTIPGFTNSSMFPALWGQHGISYSNLITKILHLALERFKDRQKLHRVYTGS